MAALLLILKELVILALESALAEWIKKKVKRNGKETDKERPPKKKKSEREV